jgi:preprotein translocase subunit SecF
MIELPRIDVDWLGKRKIFIAISIVVIGIGLVSLVSKGSFRYGVDFQGGTIVSVRFQEPPDVDRIRRVLADSGLQNSQIQELRGSGSDNDVLIQLEQTSADETDLGQGREAVNQALSREYSGRFEIQSSESVGPKAGADLRRQAVLATSYALGGILIYMAFRFELIYGAAAVIAVFHDVLVTLGFFSLFNREIDLTVVAALLTLVGYSVNDTIVIFDRVREGRSLNRQQDLESALNRGINETMSRTMITAGLTFLSVLALFLFGGSTLNNFAFALLVGGVAGTYSTLGIAGPLVLIYYRYRSASSAHPMGARAPRPAKAK